MGIKLEIKFQEIIICDDLANLEKRLCFLYGILKGLY